MDVSCEEVWREISNYLEGDLDPELRATLEAHFARCRNCSAILDGTRNVVELYGDQRMFELPPAFHRGLQQKLAAGIGDQRGSAMGWAVSLALAAMVLLALLLGGYRDSRRPELLSQHSQPALRVPAGLVAVAANSKTFHVSSCPYIHGPYRLIPPEEAIRDGYSPCIRCEAELLERASQDSETYLADEEPGGK